MRELFLFESRRGLRAESDIAGLLSMPHTCGLVVQGQEAAKSGIDTAHGQAKAGIDQAAGTAASQVCVALCLFAQICKCQGTAITEGAE